mgnify:CR=1 FL=1
MSSKERLRLQVPMIAIKETIGAVVEKTEKGTVLNRIRTQNRSIAAQPLTPTLGYQAVCRELADFEFFFSCP